MTITACDDQFAHETEPRPTVAVCARTHTSDQVLTGNYLQIDAEKLEEECRLARERGKTVCVWVGELRSTCLGDWTWGNLDSDLSRFKFCPFCGKQIKVKT
jgi:hypothetical protein